MTTRTPSEVIAELRKVHEAATPGPVRAEPDVCVRSTTGSRRALCWCQPSYSQIPTSLDEKNARAIAAEHNAFAALLDVAACGERHLRAYLNSQVVARRRSHLADADESLDEEYAADVALVAAGEAFDAALARLAQTEVG